MSHLKNLSESLVPVYGRNYSKRNLDYYRKFYLLSPDIQIVNARVHNLEWSHIRRVLSVTSPEARWWYLENASKGMWSAMPQGQVSDMDDFGAKIMYKLKT